MNWNVFDLHCDTALALVGQDLKPKGMLRLNNGHIDLERGKHLGGYAQCFAMFTYPGFDEEFGHPVTEVFDAMLANLQRELKENSDLIAQAESPGTDPQQCGKWENVRDFDAGRNRRHRL